MRLCNESAAWSKNHGAVALWVFWVASLVLFCSLLFELTHIVGDHDLSAIHASSNTAIALSQMQSPASDKHSTPGWDEYNPLGIPRGQPQNLPSIRVSDSKVEGKRKFYGGKGDKEHLGGFTEYDSHGISPMFWGSMITQLGVKSVIDVGCGRGISALWFHLQGVDTLCVEGSHDAVENSFLPSEIVVEHDFSRGPWWPAKTYDAVWSVEFLEHVGVNFHFNYMTTFRKAALVFVTSSVWGGWHHVEVHGDNWWIRKFMSYGFVYDDELTQMAKRWAHQDLIGKGHHEAPDGHPYKPLHLLRSMKVFVNPVVAALPQHAHLFFEHGCYESRPKKVNGKLPVTIRPCDHSNLESELPKSFWPLELDPAAQMKWEDMIKAKIRKIDDTPKNETAIDDGKPGTEKV